MKPYNYFLIIAVALSISSCNRLDETNEYKFINRGFSQKVYITKLDSSRFELDSLTAPVVFCIQEVTSDNKRCLAYLNDETSTIYLNDYLTKKIARVIHIDGDSIKNKKAYQGFLYHNKDSIFLFSYKPKVTLINDRGEIKQHFNLMNEKDAVNKLFFKGFFVSTALPAYLSGDLLFINSLVVGDIRHGERRKVQMILNLKNGKDSIGKMVVPRSYEGKNFGSLHYEIYGMTYNPTTEQAVYSFPADKNLVVSSLLKDSILSYAAESQYIDKFIPYDESKYKEAKSEPVGEYFMTTPTYGPALYDKYRNVYYRLALLPVNQKNVNYEEKSPPTKLISLIVVDKHFKYLGEKLLDKNKYWSSNIFVSKEGFNIQNRTKSGYSGEADHVIHWQREQ